LTIYHQDASELKKNTPDFLLQNFWQKSFSKNIFLSWAELKDHMRKAGEVTYVDAHNRMGRGKQKHIFLF